MKNKVYYVLKQGQRYYNHNRLYTDVTKASLFSSKNVAEFINEQHHKGKYKIKKIIIIEEIADD